MNTKTQMEDEAGGEDPFASDEGLPSDDELEIVLEAEGEGGEESGEEGDAGNTASEENQGDAGAVAPAAAAEEGTGEEGTSEEGSEEEDAELASFPQKVRQRFERERRLRNTIIEERNQARTMAISVAQKAQQQETELQTLRKSNLALQRQFADTLDYAYEADIRIKSEALRKAREDGDHEAEMAVTNELSALRFQQNQVRQAKGNIPKDDAPAPATAPAAQPAPTRQPAAPLAVKWLNANKTWFNSPKFKAHRSFALEVDNELGAMGYDKQSSEYYAELDRRIDEAFPTLRKKSTKPSGGVAPVGSSPAPAKSPTGKRVVQITRADMQNMRRYGLDPTNKEHLREYARNKSAA